jgi:hypothetical protein
MARRQKVSTTAGGAAVTGRPVEGRVRALGPGAALAKGRRLGPVQLEHAGCTVTARRQEIDWAGERLGVELAFTRNSARCPTALRIASA